MSFCFATDLQGYQRPLNRGDRLIELEIRVMKGRTIRDFEN